MTEHHFHYASFNVLDQKHHWDDHTREIVEKRKRINSYYPCKSFSEQEAISLFQICSLLLDDPSYTVVAYVVHHMDQSLQSDIGESQRTVGIPKQAALISDGLRLLNERCLADYSNYFDQLETKLQQQIITQLFQGTFSLQSEDQQIPAQAFIQKILSKAVSAYYSHPSVWSDIGYAGPAYPRGYVRSEFGLTDPWEARRDDK